MHKGGNGGGANDLLGGATKPDKGGESVLAIGAHDQQIGLDCRGGSQDGAAAAPRRQPAAVERTEPSLNTVELEVSCKRVGIGPLVGVVGNDGDAPPVCN